MNSLNKHYTSTVVRRQLATSAAIASVRAEGLSHTSATARRLDQYIQGNLTADQLFQQTLAEIRARSKQTVR